MGLPQHVNDGTYGAVHEGDTPGSGGDVIRGKAKYYAQQWGSNI